MAGWRTQKTGKGTLGSLADDMRALIDLYAREQVRRVQHMAATVRAIHAPADQTKERTP